MKKTSSTWRIFAGAGFLTLFLVLLSIPERKAGNSEGSLYRIEWEAAGMHDLTTSDYAQVRDTLDYHLGLWAGQSHARKYEGGMHGFPVDAEQGYFRAKYAFDFSSREDFQKAMEEVLRNPGFHWQVKGEDMWGTYAQLNGSLFVPGTDEILRLEGWNVRFARSDARWNPAA